jgi:hypothetical protein
MSVDHSSVTSLEVMRYWPLFPPVASVCKYHKDDFGKRRRVVGRKSARGAITIEPSQRAEFNKQPADLLVSHEHLVPLIGSRRMVVEVVAIATSHLW